MGTEKWRIVRIFNGIIYSNGNHGFFGWCACWGKDRKGGMMSDLIYRETAIDAMRQYAHYDDFDVSVVDEDIAVIALKDLPTVDAVEVIRCKDCKHADEYYHCIFSTIWNDKNHYCSQGERRNG